MALTERLITRYEIEPAVGVVYVETIRFIEEHGELVAEIGRHREPITEQDDVTRRPVMVRKLHAALKEERRRLGLGARTTSGASDPPPEAIGIVQPKATRRRRTRRVEE